MAETKAQVKSSSKAIMPGGWSQNICPSSKWSTKCPNQMTPIGICMHNTANSAPATNEINYMNSNNYQVSYHLAVDENQAIQGLPFDRNGWHAGDGNGQGNRKHIGIEIARSTSNDANVFAKAERRAAAVVAKLCQTYGWSTSNVLAHRDFASKNCPHRTNMGAFRKLVEEALAGKLTVEGPGTAGGTSSGSGGTTTTVKEEPASGTGTVTCDVLNVRSGPGTSNSVIGSLKRGNSVAVKAKSNGWYKVSYGSGTGWVCGDYLSVGQSSPAKAPAQSKPSSPSTSGGSAGRVSGTGGAGVNVRSGAGTRYGRIGGLAEGASVTIVGQSGGWYQIKYGSGTGWVCGDYVKKTSGGSSSGGTSTGKVSGTGGAGLNVRSGAGTGYGRIGGLGEGASVTIVGQSNGWYQIKYGSGTGWVSSQFVKKGSGGSSGGSSSGGSSSGGSTAGYVSGTGGAGVNVRSGAGTGYGRIGGLAEGASVTIVGQSNGWYKIKYGSGTGWVSSQFVRKGSGGSSSGGSSGGSTSTAGYISGTGGAGVNVRSGAGTGHSRIGGLAEGASVTIVGQSNGWYKIKYGSGTGWVSSQFVRKGSGGGGGNGRIRGDRRLANNAIQVAREMGTTGWCATGVSRAIQRTYGIFVGGNGNQIDDNLPRSMFEQLNVGLGTALQYPGIILTWERTATRLGQIYGHTAITVGNGASSCSDYYEYNTTNNGRSGFKCFQRK